MAILKKHIHCFLLVIGFLCFLNCTNNTSTNKRQAQETIDDPAMETEFNLDTDLSQKSASPILVDDKITQSTKSPSDVSETAIASTDSVRLSDLGEFDDGGSLVGNGGDSLVCTHPGSDVIESVRLLDLFEGEQLLNLHYGKLDDLNHQQIFFSIYQILDQLVLLDPVLSKSLRNLANYAEKNTVFVPKVFLTAIDDTGIISIPQHCQPLQIAIQHTLDEAKNWQIVINEDLFKLLPPRHKIALLLHEVIYHHFLNLGDTNSKNTRKFNAFINSEEFVNTSLEVYLNELAKTNLSYWYSNVAIDPKSIKLSHGLIKQGILAQTLTTKTASTKFGNITLSQDSLLTFWPSGSIRSAVAKNLEFFQTFYQNIYLEFHSTPSMQVSKITTANTGDDFFSPKFRLFNLKTLEVSASSILFDKDGDIAAVDLSKDTPLMDIFLSNTPYQMNFKKYSTLYLHKFYQTPSFGEIGFVSPETDFYKRATIVDPHNIKLDPQGKVLNLYTLKHETSMPLEKSFHENLRLNPSEDNISSVTSFDEFSEFPQALFTIDNIHNTAHISLNQINDPWLNKVRVTLHYSADSHFPPTQTSLILPVFDGFIDLPPLFSSDILVKITLDLIFLDESSLSLNFDIKSIKRNLISLNLVKIKHRQTCIDSLNTLLPSVNVSAQSGWFSHSLNQDNVSNITLEEGYFGFFAPLESFCFHERYIDGVDDHYSFSPLQTKK